MKDVEILTKMGTNWRSIADHVHLTVIATERHNRCIVGCKANAGKSTPISLRVWLEKVGDCVDSEQADRSQDDTAQATHCYVSTRLVDSEELRSFKRCFLSAVIPDRSASAN